MKLVKTLAISIFICMLSALLAWIGGYNFDTRGLDVAFYVYITLMIAIFIPVAFYVFLGE
jgi:hypothetical protein